MESFLITLDVANKTASPVKKQKNYEQCRLFADAFLSEIPDDLWHRMYTDLSTVKNTEYHKIHDFESLELDFSPYEEDIKQALCIPYKDFFPFCDDLIIEYNEKKFMLFDQYCVKPGCNCSDVFLSFYSLDITHTAERFATINYDYKKDSWKLEDRFDKESENLIRQLLEVKRGRLSEIGRMCKKRHRLLRHLYIHYRERMVPTELPGMPLLNNQKVGRNDPCPCGSGLKYKKCCGR
ncbi:MAG: SEC-C metal-binding domain-containing protein [Spirochaetia bacterium]